MKKYLLLTFATAFPASASIISWNYDRYGSVTPTDTAGVVPAANWSNSYPANPTTNLVDDTGVATTLDISYASYSGWSIQASDPGVDANGTCNKRLLNGYLNAGPAPWNPPTTSSSVTLSQIPYAHYKIIVYFSADQPDRAGQVGDGTTHYYFSTSGAASIAGENASLVQTTQADNSSYPVANYAIFSGLTGDTQTITLQMRDSDQWGGIAGFQIVSTEVTPSDVQIRISPSADHTTATLSWPDGVGPVLLQESTDLQSWQAVSPQPTTNSLVIPLNTGKSFCRLTRP